MRTKDLGSVKRSAGTWIRALGKGYLETLERLQKKRDADQKRPDDFYTPYLQQIQEHADGIRNEVCVRIDAQGRQEITVTKSAMHTDFDRLARQALRKAVRLGMPPRHQLPVHACYRFSVSFHRIPPLPLFACAFDEVKPSIECYWPLKKILRSKVELASVDRAVGPSN